MEDLPCNRRARLWRRFNVHASQIRRYHPRREIDWTPETDESGDEPEGDIPTEETHRPLDFPEETVSPSETRPMTPPSPHPVGEIGELHPSVAGSLPYLDGVDEPFHGFEAQPTNPTITRSNRVSRQRLDHEFYYY